MNLKIGGFGGGKIWNEEHLEKMKIGSSKSLKQKWESPIYRKRMVKLSAIHMKEKHKEGKIKYDTFTGKKHSEETKIKMSLAKKGKGAGKNNYQFGTIWITNDIENKKIKKEENISIGWKKGRKLR